MKWNEMKDQMLGFLSYTKICCSDNTSDYQLHVLTVSCKLFSVNISVFFVHLEISFLKASRSVTSA